MRLNEIDKSLVREELTCDVCVVGAAGSGLSAGVCAYNAGAQKVIILDKQKTAGGTTKIASGMFAVGSPAQKRKGIFDTADDCFRDLMKQVAWNVDVKLVRDWMTNSGDSIAWLESLGIEFDYIEPFQAYPDVARRNCHTLKSTMRAGRAIVDALLGVIEKTDGIEIKLETRAKHLIVDDDNKVIGVWAEGKDEDGNVKGILIHAKSVVIASGSISYNKELVKRFYPGENYANVKIMANVPHNSGDGFIMVDEIGGKQGPIATLFIGPHNHGLNASELTGVLQRRPQPVKVNRFGERFIDESVFTDTDFGSNLSRALDSLPGKICYIILDQAMLDDFMEKNEKINMLEHFAGDVIVANDKERYKFDWLKGLPADIPGEVEAGRMAVCQTLDEAAEYIGCDPETLKETMDEYNKFCDNKYDADYLKPVRHLIPIRKPPYYVISGPSGIDTCIGGIAINRYFSVLDKESNPIEGLFAAGVCTSGWLNGGYAYQGSELSFTIFSGRFAGKYAADHALGKRVGRTQSNNNENANSFIVENDAGEGKFSINEDVCINCGNCNMACQNGAVVPSESGKWRIDQDKCVGCGQCARSCPLGAISR